MTTEGAWAAELVKLDGFSVQNRVFIGQEQEFDKKMIKTI